MGIEDFISDALHNPSAYIAYHVGRELAELYPRMAIVESETESFDLEAFARDQKCSIVHETSLFNHIKTQWMGAGKDLRRFVENSWLNVLWQGHLLEVVVVTFDYDRHCWIVADDRKLAEEFFAAVCEWSTEVRGEILVFHDGGWAKNQELYKSIKSATFNNLILRAGLREQIQQDFEQFFAARESYERYGIPWKRGVLFPARPGTGKRTRSKRW